MHSVSCRFLGVLALAAAPLLAEASGQHPAENPFGRIHPPRIYRTVRLEGPPPTIDGRLDDRAWTQGEWSGEYTQQLPTEGGAPSERTELKILFDATHVYFAIRAYDDPRLVHRYPGRRDGFAGDIVGVCFDSYFDKRSGFEFDLTAGGAKIDLVLTNEGWDTSWDAVWDGKVALEADAWTAEFRIPLNQLRYGSQDEQVWGLHAWRWIDRHQEEDQWNLIPRNSTGRMYNLGELHGISGLGRSRHIELLPHAVSRVTSAPGTAADGDGTMGLDAKIGLTTDFTLDATVNPDFGQVEADPSVVNLTAYETFFEEKRPFFVEGKRMMSFGLEPTTIAGDQAQTSGDMLFYSRRIGDVPSYVPPVAVGETVRLPESTSIASAVKVTGKTRNGLSVGVLQSVTTGEHARVSFPGGDRRVPVEPLTGYFVGRVQKDWSKGNTILGGMVTSTDRAIDEPALAFLPRHALTGGVDLVRFLANRSYVVEGKATFSRVSGDREAIARMQENPVHYFQRPDATHLRVDPLATALSGHAGTVRVARYGNSKWRAANSLRWVSPGLELNDVGYLRQADFIENETTVGFQQTDPRGIFRTYGLNVERDDEWDFGGLHTDGSTSFEASAQFANKWQLGIETQYHDTRVETRLLRGGPAFVEEPLWGGRLAGSTDASRRGVVTLSAQKHGGPAGALQEWAVGSGLRVRASRRLNVGANVDYEALTEHAQYVDTVTPNGESRYLIGRLQQETVGVTLRADLQLTPDLSVQYYGSPFVSTGRYSEFKRVTEPRAAEYAGRFDLLEGGEIRYVPAVNRYVVDEGGATYGFHNPDFSFREFRSNLVTRWEFRPGSTLYLVWSQGRTGVTPAAGSLSDAFEALRHTPATNVVLLKVAYWVPF